MKIAVIGAGGVGGYFGGRLAAADNEITFVARGRHLDAIRENGLKIVSPRGDTHLTSVKAVDSIAKTDAVDLVVIAVKLWDTEDIARVLMPQVDHGAAVLSLQNGVEKDSILRKHLPEHSIIGGVSYIAAAIAGPGVISHNGDIQRLVFGEYNGQSSARTQMFLEACHRAGIDAAISDAIERLIWEKFVFLVGLSGTTTTMRQAIGAIRENAQTRSFLLDLMREVADLGRAKGVTLADSFAEDRLAFCDTLPASMTSSMYHDLQQGNRLELPWLSGAVVRLAREVGIATPLNRAVSDILEPFVRGRSH